MPTKYACQRYVHLEGGNVWQDLRKLEGWVEDLIVTYAKEWATSRNKIRVHRRRTINDEKGRLVSDYEVEMTYGEGGRAVKCTQ